MWQGIKTYALVTVVAMLIWVWAEGESLKTAVVAPRIVFVADGTDLAIKPETEGWGGWGTGSGVVRVLLEGSTQSIDEAQRAMTAPLKLKPGQPGVPGEPGERLVVDLKDALRGHPDLKRIGVTVADVQPATVLVTIVRLVKVEVPVRAELPAEIRLDGDPTVAPPVVTVRLPEGAVGLLKEGTTLTAAVSAEALSRLRDDGPQTVQGTVRLPAALAGVQPAVVTPETVSITLRVKKQVETVTVRSVPVWLSLPPTEGTKWDVQVLTPYLTDVKVTGPSDEVARIKSRDLVPIARVMLTTEDLEAGVESKEAVFADLPTSLVFSVESKVVRLKITKRKAEGGEKGTGAPTGGAGGVPAGGG